MPRRRNTGQLQWLILVALPLQAFLTAIGAKVADDAYRGLRTAVRNLRGKDDSAAAWHLVLQDPASGLQIVLDGDLPEQACQQLQRLDLSRFRLGPVRYDRTDQRWRSDLDEAQAH